MKTRSTRKPPSLEEPRPEPEKDPRDEPGPTIYGEELEGQCSPDFIVSPPPKCSTQKIEVPAFRGEFCWILFPGSEWETRSPVAKLIEAQAFFQKYCLYFNFSEKTLPADRANEYEEWYADWKAAVRQSVIPDRHVPGLRRRLVATNPGASPERIDELVADHIRQILRNTT